MKTGEQAAADQSAQVSDAIGTFLSPVLLSLGGVSVLVGAFIIFNAFSMTVAQRRREFAMLRALGASRRQVMLSITVRGVRHGRARLGRSDSSWGSVSPPACQRPDEGAERRHPDQRSGDAAAHGDRRPRRRHQHHAAVGGGARAARDARAAGGRPPGGLDAAADARSRSYAPYIAAAVAVLGVLGVVNGMYGVGTTTQRLLAMAAGAVLLFLAVAMLSKYIVAPVAGFIGWPLMRWRRRAAAWRGTTACAIPRARPRPPRR